MATGTQTRAEIRRLPDSTLPATQGQYLAILNSGSGSLQYFDPNGGGLLFTAQGGSPTITVILGGKPYILSPGYYGIPADPDGLNIDWNLASGFSIKLQWFPN